LVVKDEETFDEDDTGAVEVGGLGGAVVGDEGVIGDLRRKALSE
jgi:hypothetical protein